ncbi:PAS domain-containing sensor histidine kinase [uncultured Rummeliibacillus sp.]|uniref:PAS domain-containing sensor histidine kinase n=1 Tax=uncultured Rummeliibacillus sp. TaxID=762292 RepID=UPI00260DAB91|nr:PAS domain-containing sensor histidine kinase [uncultured Rummeliibacillus sp.]
MTREIFQAFDFSFEDCEEPIVILDHRYHVLYANDLALNLLQIEEDVNITSWFSIESLKTWKKMIENAKTHSYIAEKMTIDTIYYKIEDMKVTSYYSDVYDWILLCFHYSEAPSKIEKHYDIETKYKRVFDQPGNGFILTDKEGKIIEINEMAERLLNITSKGFIGQYAKILLTLFPKDRNKIRRFFKKLFDTGKAEVTIQVPTKEGIRYVQLMSNYDCLADIHLTILRDETEKKMMIKQIEHQQTLQMIGEMAASIAHEIKNPMTSLKGFTDLMKMTATDENKRYLSVIDSEIQRIENIVNEFLNLSKPGDYEMNVISIRELLKETIELMQPQALIHNIRIEFEESNLGEDHILGNKHKMKQVFINLLKNAIEVMPTGGSIKINCSYDYQKQVTITVQDEGTGMSEQQLQNIFMPFYTTKPEGTGLGLPFVVKTVEEHNGEIFVTSKEREGTTFEIVFPVVVKNEKSQVAEEKMSFSNLQVQKNLYYPV